MAMKKEKMKELIDGKLSRHYGVSADEANREQVYQAVVMTIRDLLHEKYKAFKEEVSKKQGKRLYYLCMEFLVGKSLRNNIDNLGIGKIMEEIAADYGVSLQELYEIEPDPGLGNGGLGRLASCFMDSLATMDYPAWGFSIRYEYGLFKQKIVDGWQIEFPDVWLPNGEAWLIPRTDETVEVHFDGTVEEQWTDQGLRIHYHQFKTVQAVPYDMMISGKDSKGVSVLRLWRAKSPLSMDFTLFSQGNYVKAIEENAAIEDISKVLYPADDHAEGKSLRLRQEYFLVSASLQTIIRQHLAEYNTLDNLSEKVVIHINDTHPALAIPELMRILMDEHAYTWDHAWEIVTHTVAYTNHTVMAEALETWPEDLIQRRIPRIHSIIHEINQRFCKQIWNTFPGDWEKSEKMAILSYNTVRMANLSIVGGFSINGVAKIHTEILKEQVFRDFYQMYPEKFTNITNGIAHRRWLCQANPELSALLKECIGDGFDKDAEKLAQFKKFENDDGVLERLGQIKQKNKEAFASWIYKRMDVKVDTNSLFDVQIKRLHEYKRQLLNALRIITLYGELLDNPSKEMQPQTFIFGAKAAPSYYMAKDIIKLIWSLGQEIEKHPVIREKLKIVFVEDYNVTPAEMIIPAAEVSEQISLAGKEASGTSNMKLMINGAITIGTMDGANVEIFEAVGNDNIFVFGLRDNEVEDLWRKGYSPTLYYQKNEKLRRCVDWLNIGFNGNQFHGISQSLLVGTGVADPYMCLADYEDYCRVHDLVSAAYQDKKRWNRMSLINIASAGRFAADRSIKEYAEKIWNIERV